MARPFMSTMRSMESDHPKTVMVVLSIAAVLVCAWNIWFFCAKISVYEMSIHAKVAEKPEKLVLSFSGPGRVVKIRQNLIIATFSINMKDRIEKGQNGLFFPAIKHGQLSEAVKCVIVELHPKTDEQSIQAVLKTIQSKHYSIGLQPGMSGLIKLEVARLSPFAILLQRINSS
jgi:hypothetical protein